ncbi:MAG TPA: glutamine--tRNA ligase, partial [Legionellales bacterium]|nr:glutamine--tRNA ligase [Legionellales bacterium]
FMEDPPKKFFRLSPGHEVRLRYAYIIRCEEIIYDDTGNIAELRCTYDPDTLGKNPTDRKVKGVIHWVSAPHAYPVELYQYDRLFIDANPARDENILQFINPHSLTIHQGFCEPALANAKLDEIFQFERLGYYCVNECLDDQVKAFHRVVGLKDTWRKV